MVCDFKKNQIDNCELLYTDPTPRQLWHYSQEGPNLAILYYCCQEVTNQ